MADDKKIIFSMVGVSKTYPPQNITSTAVGKHSVELTGM